MRFHARLSLSALLVVAIVAVSAPAAAQAAEPFGVGNFVATNCKAEFKECGAKPAPPGPYSEPKKEVSVKEAEEEGYTQAGGHVPNGVTDFTVTLASGSISTGNAVPAGIVTHIRTDVARGLATNPQGVPMCSSTEFGKEALPNTGLFEEPKCKAESLIGENRVLVFAGAGDIEIPEPGKVEPNVYNLVQPTGRSSEFGVALKLPKALTEAELKKAFAEHPLPGEEPAKKATEEFLEKKQYWAHTLIEGNVEWGQEVKGTNAGDYHDYFEIDVSPSLPLVRSRLVFNGRAGQGDFITNATNCPGNLTTTLTLTEKGGGTARKTFTTPIGLEKCELVPFLPEFALTPATTTNDEPNGITTEIKIPHQVKPAEIETSQVKTASVTLPEGMTLNPSAAHGLEACSPAQARIHSSTFGSSCPEASELGTVSLEVPGLPAGSLTGKVYLGGPETGPITGPPYIVYVVANSERYGISVRVKGEVFPNESTGQLTTVFSENPEQPFTNLVLHFKTGVLAPTANPLQCGTAVTAATFTPFSNPAAPVSRASSFGVTGCASPLPFALTQSTQNQSANAGGHTSYTFNLERSNGQQYLSQVKTVLPAGLVGAIPLVTQCGEPQAGAGTCTSASQIGTATVLAGSGATPYQFSGPVYLTGPYNGAPFGLSIAVPAVAGPFNLGIVVTRATINVDPTTARVTVTSVLPRIFKGVPLRLRRISVAVDKQGFLFNPTSCAVLATESVLTGFTPGSSAVATQSLSNPFQVGNCSALKFKPAFKAATNAKTSKANGASLETTINELPGQANIRSVLVQLPKQLPSRLSTLNKACAEAVFAANPYNCPVGSRVGGVRANTPTLPHKMTGPAYLVSHGGAAFPDLDLVLEGDGVRVILVGNTNIKKGITTTSFASTPDVPVSSITVNLPIGSHSALGAFGSLCKSPLVMPTTITAQNGAKIKQNTRIAVKGCGVRIVGVKVAGNRAFVTVQTPAGGRVSGRAGAGTVFRHIGGAGQTSLKVPLPSGRRRPFRTSLRIGFVPSRRGAASTAFVTVTVR
jgi:hypothetical protein